MRFRPIYLFTLLSVLLSTFVTAAPSTTYEKRLSETFTLAANGRVLLDNRYGEIKVNTWSQSRVKIDVLIRVEAGSESEFQDVLKRIDVSLNGGGSQVSGVTTVESSRKKGSWWTYIISSDDVDDFKIYYTVTMPAAARLEVNAQYCDVELPTLSGENQLSVGYGDLVAGQLTGKSAVDISYGSARIERLGNGSAVKFRYSEGNVRSGGDISYNGRYSEVSFGRVGDLRLDVGYEEIEVESATSVYLEGNYNDLAVESVGSVDLRGNYTEFNLGTVTGDIRVEGTYGEVEVERLAAGFGKVWIDVRYTDVEIDIDDDAGYEVDLNTTYGDIDVPTSQMTNRNQSSAGSTKSLRGSKSGKGSGVITISTVYGDIDIY